LKLIFAIFCLKMTLVKFENRFLKKIICKRIWTLLSFFYCLMSSLILKAALFFDRINSIFQFYFYPNLSCSILKLSYFFDLVIASWLIQTFIWDMTALYFQIYFWINSYLHKPICSYKVYFLIFYFFRWF